MARRSHIAWILSVACMGAAASQVLAQETVPVPLPAKEVIKPSIPTVASSLPLSDVRITGGPLKVAQDADQRDLLALDPDRMLFYLRQRAGLPPKAQSGYGGWDGAGRQLTGHIAGHYLSGISYMFADTGDKRFKDRVDYIVSELAAVQAANKDGYIGALMGNAPGGRGGGGGGGGRGANVVDGKTLFTQLFEGQIRSGGFDLNGMWSPWYVEHKIFAGLRDAYRIAGNKQALQVEIEFAAWVESILKPLSDQQIQQMLQTEFGGMNEVLADLYADTGDKRWLDLSGKFEHFRVITPMANKVDNLGGLHGNTTIPKVYGDLKRYIYSGNELDGNAANFFWEAVVDHHTFATGGHGYDESFGRADALSSEVDGTGQRSQDLRTCESCNVYNMMKMTRTLFSLHPDNKYTEFLERGIFNHVLASIDPATGQTCYMVPVGVNVTHEYQNMQSDFTCCVGTGYESQALHADGMYNESPDKLWVNLYAPSTAKWTGGGMTFSMATEFPLGETATMTINGTTDASDRTISFRHPAWAGEGFAIKVNGAAVPVESKAGSYVDVKRAWNKGDTITVTLPKTLHTEPLPDNPNGLALMWGPLVLGGDLGSGRGGGGGGGRGAKGATPDEVFVTADKALDKWLKPVSGKPGTFQAMTAGKQEITFVPFYQLAERKYGIYFDVYTPAELAKTNPNNAALAAEQQKLQAMTVSYAQPGQMQPETDHNFQGGDNTSPVTVADQPGRKGSTWFSFDMGVDPSKTLTLVVTYNGGETAKRTFDILVDGSKLASETVNAGTATSKFNDVSYKLPADVVKGKEKVTVRFQATDGNEIAGVFGIRVTKAEGQ